MEWLFPDRKLSPECKILPEYDEQKSACRKFCTPVSFFMVYKKQKICDNQNNMEPVNCNLKNMEVKVVEKPYWEGKHFSFFSNKECEYFPCHKVADPENFNCLFCYCPLYALGEKCGGNFKITEKGIKDCTDCQLPHKRKNYGYVTGKYQELAELIQKQLSSNEKK